MEHKLPVNPRYGVRGISYSDVIAIEYSVETWYHRSTGKLPTRVSDPLTFGSHVHAMIEKGKIDVPRGTDPERQSKKLIRYRRGRTGPWEEFYLIGTPDDADADTIYEYKTARKLWTYRQAATHGQFPTYAILRKEITGKAPTRGLLVCLETARDEDAGIYLTGERRIHEVTISPLDMVKMKMRFIDAYEKAVDYIHTLDA